MVEVDHAITGTRFDKLDMSAVRKRFESKFKVDREYVKVMINTFDYCHGKCEYKVG